MEPTRVKISRSEKPYSMTNDSLFIGMISVRQAKIDTPKTKSY
jgi:hypothetical protein